MTVKISKIDEVVTAKRVDTMITFMVNDKKVRVYIYENDGSEDTQPEGTDYIVDPNDIALLTNVERDAFSEEDIWTLANLKEKEELLIEDSDNEAPKMGV